MDDGGVLRSGHLAPEASPLLLRERIGRFFSELRLTPSPRLASLLSQLPPGAGLMLDLKDPVEPGRLLAALREAGVEPARVLVSTRWHSLAPGLAEAGLRPLLSLDSRPLSPARLAVEARAVGVAVRYSYLDPRFVEDMRREGLVVAAWTVNTRNALCRVAGLGVDMVVTDAPCRVRKWLGEACG